MNTKLLQGVVTLFAELTPSMSTVERMDLFKSMLPKEAAPIVAAPAVVQVTPPAAQWPGALAKPGVTAPKIDMAQALGLKPRSAPCPTGLASALGVKQIDPVANRVVAVVAEQLGLMESEVKLTSRMIADMGADDLDTVELCMALEDEFNIELDDDLYERCSSVNDLVNLVKRVTVHKQFGAAVKPVTENGRLYVNIRKHPAGFKQPTGKRKVTRLTVTGDFVEVGIGNGLQGWKISTKAQPPSYLDFIVNGEKGQKVSLPEAIAYWKRHNP